MGIDLSVDATLILPAAANHCGIGLTVRAVDSVVSGPADGYVVSAVGPLAQLVRAAPSEEDVVCRFLREAKVS